MLFSAPELESFWSAPWSVPLRLACRWLAPEVKTKVSPTALAPTWIKPLCVQRWVAQAIVARLAWMRAHPDAAAYRAPDESAPRWTEAAWESYDCFCVRRLSQEGLLWLWRVEVERLLRIVDLPPALLGETWTQSALAVCHHLSQIYRELKRRHKAMQARALLREELRRFVEWEYYGEAA